MRKKRYFLFCLYAVLCCLALVLPAAGSFVFPYVIDGSSVTSASGNSQHINKANITLSYEVQESFERTETEWTGIKDFDPIKTTSESNYTKFFNKLSELGFSGYRPENGIDVNTSNPLVIAKADGSGRLRLTVNSRVYKQSILFFTIYYGEATIEETSYGDPVLKVSDLNGVKDEIAIPLGTKLNVDAFSECFANRVPDGCSFVGFRSGTSSSGSYLNLGDTIDNDLSITAVFRKNDYLDPGNPSLLGTHISELQPGSYNYFAGGGGDGFDISSDPSYLSNTKTVFLTKPTSSDLRVANGVTVNFCLNDGSFGINNSTNCNNRVEPDQNDLQYTLVLQDDLYIDGSVTLSGSFGGNNNTGTQSAISGGFVKLDLNGHNVYVNSGGNLTSNGLIADSVGTGNIYVKGGTVQTLAVIHNYKGGTNTAHLVGGVPLIQPQDILAFPFDSFSFPYLRCRTVIQYDGVWGKLIAYCSIQAAQGIAPSNFTLNFIGPSSSDFFFQLQNPSAGARNSSEVIFDGRENASLKAAIGNDTNSLSTRVKVTFNNVKLSVGGFVFDIDIDIKITTVPVHVDSSEFIFPVPSCFDLLFLRSSIFLTQPIKLMPGATMIADENSYVYLGFSGNRSAQVSLLDKYNNYFDSETGSYITKDNASNSLLYEPPYSSSKQFLQYYGPSQAKIYGTLAFQNNSGSGGTYRLAGMLDFNKIAVFDSYNGYPEEGDLAYVDFGINDNPFAILRNQDGILIETYGFDTALDDDSGHARGYARPLVSNGKAFYTSNDLSFVGSFDFTSGVLKDSSGNTYLFDCSGSFEERDENGCTLVSASYNDETGLFTSGSTYYVYFSSMYFVTNAEGTLITKDSASRLGESVSGDINLKWDGARHLRA